MDQTFENFLTDLRSKITLYDVISQKTRLTKRGNQYWGCCPFHNEKTPSFTVSEDKGFYHCFGCGAHGEIIKFTMETYNMPFIEAVDKLANSVGLTRPQMRTQNPKELLKKNRSKELLNIACDFFISKLQTNPDAVSYLKEKRNLTDETISDFKIGYAPESNELYELLKSRNFDDTDLCDAGLFKKSDFGQKGLYFYFRNRIMFPVSNRKGEVIAFSGRIIGVGDPKYLNSPESGIFEKRFTLFGFDKALQPSRDLKEIIAVEGNIDVVSLHQAGFKNTVAPLGTALTEYQVSFMWQTCDTPTICFDGDTAGLKASVRAAHRILPYLKTEKSLKFCILPDGTDPDTILNQENGVEVFRELLQKPMSLIDILWKEAVYGQEFKTPEQKAGLEKRLMDMLEEIQDEKVKRYYIQTIKNYLWEYFKHKAEFKRRIVADKEFVIANENIKTMLAYLSIYSSLKNQYLPNVGRLILGNKNIESTLTVIYNSLENDDNLTEFHKSKLKTQLNALSSKKDVPEYIINEEFVKLLNHNSVHLLELELKELEEELKINPSSELFQRFITIKEEIDTINDVS